MDKAMVSRGQVAAALLALPPFLRRRLRGGCWAPDPARGAGGKLLIDRITDMAPARTATLFVLYPVDNSKENGNG